MRRSKEDRDNKGSKGDGVGVTLGSQTHVGIASIQLGYSLSLRPAFWLW